MKKFTHGIMAVQPSMKNEEGIPVVHFVGYWEEPTIADVESLIVEMETDESFGLVELAKANELEYYPATEDIIEYYNNVIIEDEINNLIIK